MCSTASDLIRAAHIICHEVGHHWFAGSVQTLNMTHRGFVEESLTSFFETQCVAAAVPALQNHAVYQQLFAPPFRDSRHLHIGALFHALEAFTLPQGAGQGIDTGIEGRYAKGPAVLHMVGTFLDNSTSPVWPDLSCFCCM